MQCDFCTSTDIRWKYPAKTFDMRKFGWGSVGSWAACDACHDLIEKNDRLALVARTIATMPPDIPPSFAAEMAGDIRALHDRFFEARTGPAETVHRS